MWPWGHFAVAYLCYVSVMRLRNHEGQTVGALVAVAVGSQFPDLIDKPLAWSFGVVPSGRSFAHSLLTAALVLAVGYGLAARFDRSDILVAFGIGYLSHLITDLGPDTVVGLLQGDLSQLTWTTYLLWPLLPAPPYLNDSSFGEHFAGLAFEPYMIVQFLLFGAALLVWFRSGAPGSTDLRLALQRRANR